ncbi:MAG TPA: IS200/IS605 family transposase [Myxococcales bacterium]|jgi:REP element-mobilizing transposase RayT
MSFLKLYVHLVWSTHERQRLVTTDVEGRLWALVAARCNALGARAVRVGGMPDHLHVLAEFPPDLALCKLVRDLKGGSSHAMSHVILPGRPFRWQDGYAAFTLRKEDVPVVGRYILDQKRHHAQGTACSDWELPERVRYVAAAAAGPAGDRTFEESAVRPLPGHPFTDLAVAGANWVGGNPFAGGRPVAGG